MNTPSAGNGKTTSSAVVFHFVDLAEGLSNLAPAVIQMARAHQSIHTRRSAYMAAVFPAPSGSTNTSTTRPDTATDAKAAAWSGPSIRPSLYSLLVMVSTVVVPRDLRVAVTARAHASRRLELRYVPIAAGGRLGSQKR